MKFLEEFSDNFNCSSSSQSLSPLSETCKFVLSWSNVTRFLSSSTRNEHLTNLNSSSLSCEKVAIDSLRLLDVVASE